MILLRSWRRILRVSLASSSEGSASRWIWGRGERKMARGSTPLASWEGVLAADGAVGTGVGTERHAKMVETPAVRARRAAALVMRRALSLAAAMRWEVEWAKAAMAAVDLPWAALREALTVAAGAER